jgi:hypothetical protein
MYQYNRNQGRSQRSPGGYAVWEPFFLQNRGWPLFLFTGVTLHIERMGTFLTKTNKLSE